MISNEKINRLGKRIRVNQGELNNDDLKDLQEFRTSFYEPMRDTFNRLVMIKSQVRTSAIVAFRLKRISTIVNKVFRENGMKLSRMGDIAGLRVIFDSDREVYKALDLILKEFELSGKIRDYISDPKPIGYRGIHIYVKDKASGKRIEIQLRTVTHHNWSTLVEITDLLYGTRLKELGYKSDPEFAEFHSLMSSDKELSTTEAELIYKVLEERNFINKLSKLFRKNSSKVRDQWNSSSSKNKYFLIEASKNTVPVIKGFKIYSHAEEEYFKRYKSNDNKEIVLATINKPTFNQLSLAYSNYILSYHTFISDAESIIKNLAIRALEDKNVKRFKTVFCTYETIQTNVFIGILSEGFNVFMMKKDGKIILAPERKLSKTEEIKLKSSLSEKAKKRTQEHKDFINELELYIPNGFIKKWKCEKFLKEHGKRTLNILKEQSISVENQSDIQALL
ncbi:RelA/SpoT domain-containing protein [Dokdonia sp. PRO95]|uniref:RelA/SpoT domain-containing protein n=1 Tax=Dokdonia sp. PRO95 TaxID=1239415 RepID=UPI0006912E91|nr:RelA/SpoT domain-containing protein [Dokdonia sp. PRO95]